MKLSFSITSLALLSSLVFSSLSHADSQPHEPEPSINVSGIGEVSVSPDKAIITVSIEARRKRIQAARDEVNAVIGRALAVTDSLAIERQYVNSSASNIRPEYRHHNGKRNFEGYYVSRQLVIDLRDLEQIGALNEKLLDAGINNVSAPRLGSTQAAEHKRQALTQASKDARKNAQALASGLGVKLGKVLSLNAHSNHHNPLPRGMMMKAAYAEADTAAPSETYETGQIRFRANVNARFAIAD